jgi:NB-ARC domain
MTDGERNISIKGSVVNSTLITGDIILPVPTAYAPFQLRAPVVDFVGRDQEIAMLINVLRSGENVAITAISGMGGIGKTELAILIANRLRENYPDAQLLIDMHGTDIAPRDPKEVLASCIRAFVGPKAELETNLEGLISQYRSCLTGKRALVILDNAVDNSQIRPLMPPIGCVLLITSRNSLVLPGITRLILDQLRPEEARDLLTKIAPRVKDDIADHICSLCGYLPLAVRAASSLLALNIDLEPLDYLEQLHEERTRLENLSSTEAIDVGVEASFNLS